MVRGMWFEINRQIRKVLKHLYYRLPAFQYYEENGRYVAWMDKREIRFKPDMEYVMEYCRKNNVKLVVVKEDPRRIYLKFQL